MSSIIFDPECANVFRREVLNMISNSTVSGKESLTYIEAILEWCEMNNIDPDVVSDWIDKPMKEHLKAEGMALHLIPGKTKGLDV